MDRQELRRQIASIERAMPRNGPVMECLRVLKELLDNEAKVVVATRNHASVTTSNHVTTRNQNGSQPKRDRAGYMRAWRAQHSKE